MSQTICTSCGEAIEFVDAPLPRFVTVGTGATYCTAHPMLGGHTLPRVPFVAMVGKIGPAFASATEPRRTASAEWVVNDEYAANVPPMIKLGSVFHVAGETVAVNPWTRAYVDAPRRIEYADDFDY